MEEIRLPIIVCGELIYPDGLPEEKLNIFEFESGVKVILPKLQEEHIRKIERCTNDELHSLSIDEIAVFLDKVSRMWRDPDYEFRETAVEYISKVTGYCTNTIKNDLEFIAYSAAREKLYEIVETDLENAYYLDEFIPFQSVLRHAQPKGTVLHVMVGNVPMAGLFTLIRTVITKNLTLAKLPSRDPITVLMFALSFIQLDSAHPVSKSLTVAYWEPMDETGRRLIKKADAVCTWGKEETMNNIRSLLTYGQDIIEFGPKRSMAVFFEEANLEEACMRLAVDMSFYDQEACFCPQQLFIQNHRIDDVNEALAFYLNRVNHFLPKIFTPIGIAAYKNNIILESEFMGDKVVKGENNIWTLINKKEIGVPEEHPLSRTMYIYEFKETSELEKIITKDVQTISIYPWDKHRCVADRFTKLGSSRIVETGMSNKPRVGFTHDTNKVLSRLVNWVAVERGTDFMYKFGRFNKADAEVNLFGGKRDNKAKEITI